MLCITRVSLKEHWREGCICFSAEFKYQQAFSRIVDYTFKSVFTDGNAGLSSTTPDRNIPTTMRWIAITFCTDTHVPLWRNISASTGIKFGTNIHGSLKFKISHIWAKWIARSGKYQTIRVVLSLVVAPPRKYDTHTLISTPKGPPSFDEDSTLGNLCCGIKWANRRNMHTLRVTST